MTITTAPALASTGDRQPALPRHLTVSGWAVPVLVVGQFALVAVLPVTLLAVGVLRHSRSRALRWATAALATAYATPLAVWALRDDPARSLSRDLHPVLAGLIVVASAGVLVALHRRPTSPVENGDVTQIVLPGLVEPDGLVERRVALPALEKHQAVVEMRAAGVSFAESSMRRGLYPTQPAFPFVPGYDVVGIVSAVGPGVDERLIGRRVASVTKTGGWATRMVLDTRDLVPVPDGADDAEAVALAVNGITAWQMLHRKAGAHRGQTILVHGASGGVGYTLAQLALHDGIHVIGSASPRHHQALRDLGVDPVDYRDPTLADKVRSLAPGGVDAVFDNLGGASFEQSFSLLAPGGVLVGYGTTSQQDSGGNMLVTFAGILSRFAWWSVLPNRRSATFYNFWAGKVVRPTGFRRRLADDAAQVYARLVEGSLRARVAERVPLVEASRALSLFESRTADGKVVLVP